jgi:hypothetical protein
MERDLTTGATADPAHPTHEAHSAVSWGAIFAGAVAALALSFVLLALAAGFGMKLASPWPGAGPSAETFTPILGAIAIVVQVLCAALGGYLAGRLRTKWVDVHSHEVHFRDTAHGLLVWALSTVAGVILVGAAMAPAASRQPSPAVVVVVADPAAVRRAENIAAQVSLFMGIGLLLSAFTASVAAGIGGLRRDEMHATYWSDRARTRAASPLGDVP